MQGGMSNEGRGAAHMLRMLQPTEAIGITCLLIDELAVGSQGRQATLLASVLGDLAGYAQMVANRINNNARDSGKGRERKVLE